MPKKPAVIQEKVKDRRKNIIKIVEKLAYRYGRHTVWDDWIYMSAASMSQAMDFRQGREDEYLRRINSYDKEYHTLFAEMLGELAFAYEEECFGDILGDIYSSLELTNKKNGQFFTPYHVCKMMAAMQTSKEHLPVEIQNKGYITVNDPCCGAGAMLIAFAEQCLECGINYQQSVLFVAQDIDPVAARMCYVQMSQLGMPGYVIIGNTFIPSDNYDIWFTPMYFLQGFHKRTQTDMPEKAAAETTAPDIVQQPETQKIIIPAAKADVVLRETDSGQFAFDLDFAS